MKTTTLTIKSLVIGLSLLIGALISASIVQATGGAYKLTKHGGANPDGRSPAPTGVDRSTSDGSEWDLGTNAVSGYSVYGSGQCTHCHEIHASFGGSEPAPVDSGPHPYLTFKDATITQSGADFCLYCHDEFTFSGMPSGFGVHGVFQNGFGNVYENSSHYLSNNFLWPGIGTDIHPRNTRSTGKGTCLNCHTPHGILESSGNEYDTAAVPATNHLAANNSDVATDYLIPRQKIAWEEALCENCHDGSPASTDIKAEIDKRGTYPASNDSNGGSGHPVDYTTYAGRHSTAEAVEVTSRHVECYDCHNPHAVTASNRVAGTKYVQIDKTTQIAGVSGASDPNIHEVCFRCHGETWNQVFSGSSKIYPTETTLRPPGMSNKRKEFDPNSSDGTYGPGGNNSAYHPVATTGRNTTAALNDQLIGGLSTSSTINCTDCHNNEAAGGIDGPVTKSNLRGTDVSYSGAASPLGPHGSKVSLPGAVSGDLNGITENQDRSILRDYFFTGPLSSGSNTGPPFTSDGNVLADFKARFQLCFNCHDVNTFYGNNKNTNYYRGSGGGGGGGMGGGGGGGGPDNLHAFHLRGLSGGSCMMGSWQATREACMTCHYNVHSNVEATNTKYGDGTSSTGCSGCLPPGGDTHLINFAPNVVTAYGGETKPRWYYKSNKLYCLLYCHGVNMSSYSYNCSHSANSSNGTNTCN